MSSTVGNGSDCDAGGNISAGIIDENLIKNKQVIPYQINNNLFLLCVRCRFSVEWESSPPPSALFFPLEHLLLPPARRAKEEKSPRNGKNHVPLFIYFLFNSIFVDGFEQTVCDCREICLSKSLVHIAERKYICFLFPFRSDASAASFSLPAPSIPLRFAIIAELA
jgi:hypothetical protein